MTNHTDPTTELRARLDQERNDHFTNDDGEEARVCAVDGYPSNMTCTCSHNHNRHSGTDTIRCMSYVGLPDCDCTQFTPDAASVTSLWLRHGELLRALDVDAVLALVPDVRVSMYVRDWPADEQAIWDSYDNAPTSRDAALEACAEYRRQKVTTAVLTAVVRSS